MGDLFDSETTFVEKYFHTVDFSTKKDALDGFLSIKGRKKPLFLITGRGKNLEPGKANSLIALRSYHVFQKALKLFVGNPTASLVTLPVSKEFIMKAGVSFTGHTEELAAAFQKSVFMCMYHKNFSVLPLTNHIALAQVPRKLYEVSLNALTDALRQFTAIFEPKKGIAWCGVNPHCGEDGRVGTEEEFVRRGISFFENKSLRVDGPISADAVFTKRVRDNYSLILANYHDQGLIPFKALAGLSGVNATLGLPRLRVSPDHGTAYSQTALKQVDTTGVLASLQFALRYAKKWQQASGHF
ncbi:MAG TPA: 4-hydroxythreonine-4-phosphate dehydrogenase PdxA [Turneriella sp.]|nr:4-hydroxythreonine-4-phosphate dehydrogenase PdxA [Turneriella sp.]